MGATASDLEASPSSSKYEIATLRLDDKGCLEGLDIMKLLYSHSPTTSLTMDSPLFADSSAGHRAAGSRHSDVIVKKAPLLSLLRAETASVSTLALKSVSADIYGEFSSSLNIRRLKSRRHAHGCALPLIIETEDDSKCDSMVSTTPRMARSSSIPDLRSMPSTLFKDAPSDKEFIPSAYTLRREEYFRSLLTHYSDEELVSDYSDDDDDVRKRLSGVGLSPLTQLKSVAFLDDDLRSTLRRKHDLDLDGDSSMSGRLEARTKCVLMKFSAATIHINVIGVMFGKDSSAALPFLQKLSPRSLKHTMKGMSEAVDDEIGSLFSFDSPEWLMSETSERVLSPPELKEIQGAFWNGVYLSAVLQTSASAPWLKPKSKRRIRKKTTGVWVSDKQKTDCFDSFDSELIFMDSIMRFRIPPFKTAADSTTIGATLNGLHPQIAFNCFEAQSAEAPGSVLLRVKQLGAKKSRRSEYLGVAMLYVRDLFEAVSVAPKSEHSEVHLFQLPLFEAVDNAHVKATALLMSKKGVSTADALLREAADETSSFNEDIVKKPAAKGVMVCSVEFAWD